MGVWGGAANRRVPMDGSIAEEVLEGTDNRSVGGGDDWEMQPEATVIDYRIFYGTRVIFD